jgi:protein TonB
LSVRDTETRIALLAASVALHLLVFYTAGSIPLPDGDDYELIEFEVAQEPPKPKPKPKPKPPPPPPEEKKEDPPEETKEEPKVEPKVRPKQTPPKPKPAEPPPPAPPKQFVLPPSGTVAPGEGDGTMAPTGTPNPGGYDPGGKPGGKEGGKRGGTGKTEGTQGGTGDGKPTEKPWSPVSELYLKRGPVPAKAPPKLQCPATRSGVSGTVLLKVQVRSDGTLRSVKVAKGIGSGCDEIAIKAVRKAKFKPALTTAGQPTDAVLQWEYVFRPAD